MEKTRLVKEQEIVRVIDWFDSVKHWVAWDKASKPKKIYKLDMSSSYYNTSHRTHNVWDKLINNVEDFSDKNCRQIVFDFDDQICTWNASFQLNPTRKLHEATGSLSWNDELINTLHDVITDRVNCYFKYNSGNAKVHKQIEKIEKDCRELASKRINCLINSQVKQLLSEGTVSIQ